MASVTLSSKYQAVIPRDIRRAFKLVAGKMIDVFVHEGNITLIPIPPMKQRREHVRRLHIRVARDADRI